MNESAGAAAIPFNPNLLNELANRLNVLYAIKALKPLDECLKGCRSSIVESGGKFHQYLKHAIHLLDDNDIQQTTPVLETLNELEQRLRRDRPSILRPNGPYHQNIKYSIDRLMAI